MSTQQLVKIADDEALRKMESALIIGDLSDLSPSERILYYQKLCQSLGLNPLTRPFRYITLQGRLTLYARKDATDQLRSLRGVSITGLEREMIGDIYAVTAHARIAREERTDSAIGAVSVAGLRGDELANAIMRAETKAKRRVTLSICGLGFLDETEVESIPPHERAEVPDELPPSSSFVAEEMDDDLFGEEPPSRQPAGFWDLPPAWQRRFWERLNQEAEGYYKHQKHAESALRQAGFTAVNRSNAAEALTALLKHAQERREQQPGEPETEGTDG